ncbi:MAG: hydrolase [Gemmatimonadota bacterium]
MTQPTDPLPHDVVSLDRDRRERVAGAGLHARGPDPFRPARWLPGPHAQTIVGRFLRPAAPMTLTRERIETPDGDFLDLELPGAADLTEDSPTVLALHGLEGHGRARYMLTLYRELLRRGIRPVGMNFRSCSGEPNRTARFYHSGETEDMRLLLDRLRSRWPDAPLGAVGFSLGGNMLLKHLGETGEASRERVDAAVAVSVPFDLAAGARAIERPPMGTVYTWYFLRKLRGKMRAKSALMRGRCDLERALRARTLREFDDAATAPLHGFEDAADYYRRSSCARYIDRIGVPTLILHAEDDPFLPGEALPRDAIAANPWLVAGITARGGHMGFVEGSPWAPEFWAEREAAAFLAARLGAALRDSPTPAGRRTRWRG